MRRLLSSCLALIVVGLGTVPAAYAQEEETIGVEPDIVTTYPAITGERIYLVEEGDTLWDIAEQFFDDAHFWPTLWAFNPQITNPHWIYPGDWVVIVPKSMLGSGPGFVWASSRYTQQATEVMVMARSKGFIPERTFKESGKIRHSREEKQLLGQYDEVYIEFYIPKKIKRGEEFTVYHVEGEVRHPVSGELLGYKVKHLGVTKVLGAEKRFVKGLLFTTYEEIERGDLVTDIFQHQFMVGPKANKVDLDAIIVEAFEETNYLGEHHYVFLDKGRNDGVVAGNRFVVVTRGDGYVEVAEGDKEDLPEESIGEVMIVEPYDNTSLGIITRSVNEIRVGQKCQMRIGYGIIKPVEQEKKQQPVGQ